MTKGRNDDIISGWQAIADHLEVSVRTAQRYGHEKGMPFKQPGGARSMPFASKSAIDAWLLGSYQEKPLSDPDAEETT